MDKIDAQILNALATNAKKPLRELAVECQVSFVTVMNRIKKLEKEGLIKSYQAKLDLEKAGYGVHVIFMLRIGRGKVIETLEKIAKYEQVYYVCDITGDFDAQVHAKFKSTREMDGFLKKLQTFEAIERTLTLLVLHTLKDGQTRI